MTKSAPSLLLNIEYEPTTFGLIVRYTPVGADGIKIEEWAGTLSAPLTSLSPTLFDKVALFFDLTARLLPDRPIPFPDGTTVSAGRPTLTRFSISEQSPDQVSAYTGPPTQLNRALIKCRNEYSLDGQRLLTDVLVSIEAECWKHLESRVGKPMSEPNLLQVFISYRKRPNIEQFAEAIAVRLEQEGIRPRFDKWDMVAGDSLAGKIEEAFAASRACLIILSAEFTVGRWATTEMRTAITKRVSDGFRVIPILFEECAIPELLKDPIRVDFRDHNPDQFEVRMRDVIQGIFGLTRKPFAPL
jgi:TIR domain